MIAPTHIGFALIVGNLADISPMSLKLLAIGSVIPDIDHPQSFVGKIFSPVSIAINRRFGHRKFMHSLILWAPLAVLSYYLWMPMFWLCIGAVTHGILDCWTKEGVRLFYPLFDSTVVLMSRQNRIESGGRYDYMVLICFWLLAWGTWEVRKIGGFRYALSYITGSYKMAREYYIGSGSRICHMKGLLRFPNGYIRIGKWKVIGTEGQSGIAIWSDEMDKVLHLPADASFVACWIQETGDSWNHVLIHGSQEVRIHNGVGFAMPRTDGHYWMTVKDGELVSDTYLNYEMGIVELQPETIRIGGLIFDD